jgi:L(+)-tartrate dehydratase beta subunit
MRSAELNRVRLTTPIDDDDIASLNQGDVVFLDGLVYTARESVYARVLDDAISLPLDVGALTNVNFHCSPAATPVEGGGYEVGAVTATASFRFARWMARWLELSGARMVIGKGGMSEEIYRDVFVPRGAVYLTTVGYGTGALLGRGIKGVRDVVWLDELGIAQAMWVFEVENFGPFLVDSDLQGNSLFEQQTRQINARLGEVYAGLKRPALGRFGETDDRTDELV